MHHSYKPSRNVTRLLPALSLLLCVFCSGCLCTFERDWRAAQKCLPPADNLAGLWEGTWESHYNGHDGTLRAIITPCGDGRYIAQYKGTFAYIVPFAYTTTHYATSQGAATQFAGEESLGPLFGGTYRMQGCADGRSFTAHYQADKDHGVFRMQRVGCGNCGCGSCGCAAMTQPGCCDVSP